MIPASFIHKPTPVTAFHWDGTPESTADLTAWITSLGYLPPLRDETPDGEPALTVYTREATSDVVTGDWVVLDPSKGFLVVPDTDFVATYTPTSTDRAGTEVLVWDSVVDHRPRYRLERSRPNSTLVENEFFDSKDEALAHAKHLALRGFNVRVFDLCPVTH